MVAVRRTVRREFGRNHHPTYRGLAKAFAALVWPVAVLVRLWDIRRFQGPDWIPLKRVPGALWAALRHNVMPGEYYCYELWRPARRAKIDSYLYAKEGLRLFKLINRPREPNPIHDKLEFDEMCKTLALPRPEVLATFAPGFKLLRFANDRPPKRHLFVKPRFGSASDGTERLRWRDGIFESSRDIRLEPEQLDGYLATRARTENRTLLVQPELSNHPVLGMGPNANLAVTRLITGRSTDGDIVPICGFIYFPQADSVSVRYVSVALIDILSGRLISAPQELWGERPLEYHPDPGCTLPDWEIAMQRAKIAHGACSGFAFIGWDIAFTPQGPVLLEGNENWSAGEYQRLSGEPLGHTKFPDVLATWLNR